MCNGNFQKKNVGRHQLKTPKYSLESDYIPIFIYKCMYKEKNFIIIFGARIVDLNRAHKKCKKKKKRSENAMVNSVDIGTLGCDFVFGYNE